MYWLYEPIPKHAFEYDHEAQILKAAFRSGSMHEFFDITPSVYEAMIRAPSEVEFFNRAIWSRFEHTSNYDGIDGFFRYFIDNDFSFAEPVDVDSRNCDSDTPLHVVCCWGDVSAVELLIQAGANVNAIGDMGESPLHVAAGYGFVRCAQRLLAAGASPDVNSAFGYTSREKASKHERRIEAFAGASPLRFDGD